MNPYTEITGHIPTNSHPPWQPGKWHVRIRALIQYKMWSYLWRNSHFLSKTIDRSFFLHNGNSYFCKTVSSHRVGPQGFMIRDTWLVGVRPLAEPMLQYYNIINWTTENKRCIHSTFVLNSDLVHCAKFQNGSLQRAYSLCRISGLPNSYNTLRGVGATMDIDHKPHDKNSAGCVLSWDPNDDATRRNVIR